MSRRLIARSPDLQKLQSEGYEVAIRSSYLLISNVPYLNSSRQVKRGILVTPLVLNGDRTLQPNNHQSWFIGEHPCDVNGAPLHQIRHATQTQTFAGDVTVHHSFSAKPSSGAYADYYELMTTYIGHITAPAEAIDPNVSARTYTVIEAEGPECVFQYEDTFTARARIGSISEKLKDQRIGIIGLGGTGSYILDFVAKTPVQEIHLFDRDEFVQHNAFRSPGAPDVAELNQKLKKVEYHRLHYSRMHRHITAHPEAITEANVSLLDRLTFVFLAIDDGPSKRIIMAHLISKRIPFIDAGIGVFASDSRLGGMVRTTFVTPDHHEHMTQYLADAPVAHDEYSTNIQIAELNALNAVMAVIKWKKHLGFYDDQEHEATSLYSVNVNQLLSADHAAHAEIC